MSPDAISSPPPPFRSSTRSRRSPATTAAWLVDIWGVMHNGVRPFVRRVRGLRALSRRRRPRRARLELAAPARERRRAARPHRRAAHELGRDRQLGRCGAHADRGLCGARRSAHRARARSRRSSPASTSSASAPIAPMRSSARACSTTSARRPTTTRRRSQRALARGLPMICANPDLDGRAGRAHHLLRRRASPAPTSGSAASVAYAGKPYLPIYELAFETLEKLRPGSADRVAAARHRRRRRAPTSPAPRRPACGRCSWRAACTSTGGLDAAALEALFPPGAPRPIAAMAKLAW